MPRRTFVASGRRLGRSLEQLTEAAQAGGEAIQRLTGAVQELEPTLNVLALGQRRCGYRLAGAIYVAFARREDDDLLRYAIHPSIPVDPAQFGISPIGVTVLERNGVHHIIDWIGEEHYPTPESFMEEVARMGLSRRVPRNMDFGLLNEDSRVLCVHRRDWQGAPTSNRPVIFASFPISALHIINDPVAQTHQVTRHNLRGAPPDRGYTNGGIEIRLEDH